MANKYREQYKRDIKSRYKRTRHYAKGHKKAIKIHARYRMDERLGVHLNKEKERKLIERIKLHEGRLIERQSHRRFVVAITIDGLPATVVYDSKLDCIVTAWRDEQ